MSKAVLISIRPEWCEKIINGQKTIEVRKTRPKIETPFKCYIYETKAINHQKIIVDLDGEMPTVYAKGKGKIIGEFICDSIETIGVPFPAFQNQMRKEIIEQSCMGYSELHFYAGHRSLYGWHISDLVIYDKPKDIRQVAIVDKEAVKMCPHRVRVGQSDAVTKHNGWIKGGYGCEKEYAWEVAYEYCDSCRCKPLNRPPQSWCYVEKVT